MEKQEVNPLVAIVAIVLLFGVVIGVGYYFTRPQVPLRAGVDYTPGKPPWEDPKFKGSKTVNLPPGTANR